MADEKNRFQKQAKVGREGEIHADQSQIYHFDYHACMTLLAHKLLKVAELHPLECMFIAACFRRNPGFPFFPWDSEIQLFVMWWGYIYTLWLLQYSL